MSFVIRYIVSRTGADEGHRLAASSTVRPGGITNWSRTAAQNRSSGDEGVGGKSAGRGQAVPGVRNGAAPPIASSRAKSRRFIVPPRIGSPNTGISGYSQTCELTCAVYTVMTNNYRAPELSILPGCCIFCHEDTKPRRKPLESMIFIVRASCLRDFVVAFLAGAFRELGIRGLDRHRPTASHFSCLDDPIANDNGGVHPRREHP